MGGATISKIDGEPRSRALRGDPLAERLRMNDLACPHCGSITYRRSSRLVTPIFREIRFACLNEACAHTFVASLSYSYGLSPSGIPDPAVDLPMRPMERIPGLTIAQSTGPPDPGPNQPGLFDPS